MNRLTCTSFHCNWTIKDINLFFRNEIHKIQHENQLIQSLFVGFGISEFLNQIFTSLFRFFILFHCFYLNCVQKTFKYLPWKNLTYFYVTQECNRTSKNNSKLFYLIFEEPIFQQKKNSFFSFSKRYKNVFCKWID